MNPNSTSPTGGELLVETRVAPKSDALIGRRVFLVLPAYNEGVALINLLHRAHETFTEFGINATTIVVDDGSTDGTWDNVEPLTDSLRVELLKNPQNAGLGKTLKRGLYFAMSQAQPEDIIVTMDGDDTHPPASIPEMLEKIDAGFDVVIASRYCPGATVGGLSPFREWLSGLGRYLFIGIVPIDGVKDFTCGYRAFRVSALQKGVSRFGEEFMTETGFTVTADLLLRLRKCGLRFTEVPLHLAYQNKTSPSKMKVLKTTWRTLQLILRRRLGA